MLFQLMCACVSFCLTNFCPILKCYNSPTYNTDYFPHLPNFSIFSSIFSFVSYPQLVQFQHLLVFLVVLEVGNFWFRLKHLEIIGQSLIILNLCTLQAPIICGVPPNSCFKNPCVGWRVFVVLIFFHIGS